MRKFVFFFLFLFALVLVAGVASFLTAYFLPAKVVTEYKYVRPPSQPLEKYSLDESLAILSDRPAWTDFPALDLPRLPTESALKGLVIVIDPGHGGANGQTGRAGPTGVKEKQINLQVSLMLEKMLKDAGAFVTLTRRTDIDVSFEKRVEIANTVKRPANAAWGAGGTGADLFISVHHNTSSNTNTNWSSIWYHMGVNQSEVSLDIAQKIALRMGQAMRTQTAVTSPLLPDTNMYKSGFQVLRMSNVPAVLLESSFYTNAEEELRLGNPGYLLRQAWSIYAGLCDYAYLGRPTQTMPVVERKGNSLEFSTYLLEGLPNWWGAKDRTRTLTSTIELTLYGRDVPFEYDPETRLLTAKLPAVSSNAVLTVRHMNKFKHSNWPQRFELSSSGKISALGNIRSWNVPLPKDRPTWMTAPPTPPAPPSSTPTPPANRATPSQPADKPANVASQAPANPKPD